MDVVEFTLSDATLPTGDRDINVNYNKDYNADCIWLLGGNACPKCVYCYNITGDSIYYYDTLSTGGYTRGKTSSVMLDDTIYYVRYNGIALKYNISNQTETIIGDLPLTHPCIEKHPNNTLKELYFIDGDSGSTKFYVYNLDNNSYYQSVSLYSGRLQAECIINDYYPNEPYFLCNWWIQQLY